MVIKAAGKPNMTPLRPILVCMIYATGTSAPQMEKMAIRVGQKTTPLARMIPARMLALPKKG